MKNIVVFILSKQLFAVSHCSINVSCNLAVRQFKIRPIKESGQNQIIFDGGEKTKVVIAAAKSFENFFQSNVI